MISTRSQIYGSILSSTFSKTSHKVGGIINETGHTYWFVTSEPLSCGTCERDRAISPLLRLSFHHNHLYI